MSFGVIPGGGGADSPAALQTKVNDTTKPCSVQSCKHCYVMHKLTEAFALLFRIVYAINAFALSQEAH